MTRLVRHTNEQPGRGEDAQLRPFTDFTDHASLVLLGTRCWQDTPIQGGGRSRTRGLSQRTGVSVYASSTIDE